MRTIAYIVQKEFKQIFRNRSMLPLIFVMPLVQLIILAHAATFEVRNIKISFVDHDHSRISREIIEKFKASDYFIPTAVYPNHELAMDAMQSGKTDVIVEIPQDLERKLIRKSGAQISVLINAIDGAAAAVENVYVQSILQSYGKELHTDFSLPKAGIIRTEQSYWFNTTLDYLIFMVPGILVLLVTMVTMFLAGMNIVREKEIGTLEQINVTPIRKSHFIIGKLFPFWVIAIFLLTIGLLISRLLYHVPMVGSAALMYGFTAIYTLVVLGIGLLISNYTDTQQQAMFLAWFFMVIFILLSGLFTPVESMPQWAQVITQFNPIRHFVEVMRMVMLKGSGFQDILPQFTKISIYAIAVNVLAVVSYRKVA